MLIRRQTEMADEGCPVISLSHLPLADERGADERLHFGEASRSEFR